MRNRWAKITIGVLCTMVIGVYFAYRHLDTPLRNAYAQWWVAGMVIDHLEANEQ